MERARASGTRSFSRARGPTSCWAVTPNTRPWRYGIAPPTPALVVSARLSLVRTHVSVRMLDSVAGQRRASFAIRAYRRRVGALGTLDPDFVRRFEEPRRSRRPGPSTTDLRRISLAISCQGCCTTVMPSAWPIRSRAGCHSSTIAWSSSRHRCPARSRSAAERPSGSFETTSGRSICRPSRIGVTSRATQLPRTLAAETAEPPKGSVVVFRFQIRAYTPARAAGAPHRPPRLRSRRGGEPPLPAPHDGALAPKLHCRRADVTSDIAQGAPIGLFIYKRPEHARRAIVSLQACDGAESSPIYVFADGPKSDAEATAVRATRAVARGASGQQCRLRRAGSGSGPGQLRDRRRYRTVRSVRDRYRGRG